MRKDAPPWDVFPHDMPVATLALPGRWQVGRQGIRDCAHVGMVHQATHMVQHCRRVSRFAHAIASSFQVQGDWVVAGGRVCWYRCGQPRMKPNNPHLGAVYPSGAPMALASCYPGVTKCLLQGRLDGREFEWCVVYRRGNRGVRRPARAQL